MPRHKSTPSKHGEPKNGKYGIFDGFSHISHILTLVGDWLRDKYELNIKIFYTQKQTIDKILLVDIYISIISYRHCILELAFVL